MTDKEYSQRRACRLVGLAPKTYRYASKRPDDEPIRQRLRELATERRRFGYRRLHILLRREGVMLNWKKLYRLYREERLMVRKRGGRKRALGTRAPMAIPQGANQRWSLDFVSDALACGRKFRILTVVDDFSRECLALVADNSLSGMRVARELDRIVEIRGRPCMIVSDNVLTQQSMGKTRQQISLRRREPVARCRSKDQVASTVQGCALNHSKRRIRGNVAVLTVLKTRYATKWKARTLSTGSQGELRPYGSIRARSFHLAPADQRTAGNRLRERTIACATRAILAATAVSALRRRCLFSGSLAI